VTNPALTSEIETPKAAMAREGDFPSHRGSLLTTLFPTGYWLLATLDFQDLLVIIPRIFCQRFWRSDSIDASLRQS
jgi:hypothetical protein